MTAGTETEKAKFTPSPNAVDITPNKDGGVLKEIVKQGEGTARPGFGCTVKAHYCGTLTDGTVFDSSKESNTPFEFTLGKGSVIKAWDIGVATMKKGEVAMFTCKPEYAYGASGSPPKIPPNSTLIFEITLLSWHAEDLSKNNDNGILRTIITEGKDYSTPNDGASVEVHITGSYEGKVFDDRDDLKFILGEGCESGVIKGIEIALSRFKKKEVSSLEIKPQYAFKQEGHKEFGVPPNATVTYVVELKNFERAKETWDMDSGEKLSQAKILKEKATNYFKAGKFDLAAKIYSKMVSYVDDSTGFSQEENTERETLLIAAQLNLGLTYLKLNQNYEAKTECDKVLELAPENVKGLFRRGQAYLNMSEPENAKRDFEAVVRLEPANKLAANQIIACYNMMKRQRAQEKKIYANMFEKFAAKDKEKEKSKEKPETEEVKELGEWGGQDGREPTELEQENINMMNVEMIN